VKTDLEEALQNLSFSLPDALKTAEICLAAVQQDGRALDYVPEELKTQELCLAAVQQYGYAFRYVPDALKTIIKEKIEQ
jgi:hypothetical protein